MMCFSREVSSGYDIHTGMQHIGKDDLTDSNRSRDLNGRQFLHDIINEFLRNRGSCFDRKRSFTTYNRNHGSDHSLRKGTFLLSIFCSTGTSIAGYRYEISTVRQGDGHSATHGTVDTCNCLFHRLKILSGGRSLAPVRSIKVHYDCPLKTFGLKLY